jgi:hypothetical protein
MKFYGLKLHCKVSFKSELRQDTQQNKKFHELKYNDNVRNMNYT